MVWQRTAVIRTAIGLAQGLLLYLLHEAAHTKNWPATDPLVFAPLLAVGSFVPVIAVSGFGNLRPRTLAIWLVASAVLCAALSFYDIYRDPEWTVAGALLGFPRLYLTAQLWTALVAGLFILHSLITSGDADRRFVASYPRYFDMSWKYGVQYVLTVIFVGVFWALLWLGAEMFRLIKLEWLANLIKHDWFWIPVTALATTTALHVTDVHAGLVRGARTLKLTLLSWLLPVMTAIAVLFVLSLPFTGLEPLWGTRRATFILLISAAVLVFLINAAYQDGEPDAQLGGVLGYVRMIAAVVLVPLVALAGYGLMLRVRQYGWTPERINALACFAVLACYAVGYAAACILSGTLLRQVQITNIAAAYVTLGVLLALFSPIADPARISVADQVSRLNNGQIAPEKFDYRFLRFYAGRAGRTALAELAARTDTPRATVIAQHAAQALNARNRYQALVLPTATLASRTEAITVAQPAGQSLPEDFLHQEWSSFGTRQYLLPRCLVSAVNAKCEAFLLDVDGDGKPEILLFGLPTGPAAAFKKNDNGWVMLGPIQNSFCKGVRDALRAGHFTIAEAQFRDIEANGTRLRIGSECAPAVAPDVVLQKK